MTIEEQARELVKAHVVELRKAARGRREVAASMMNADGEHAQLAEADRLDELASAIEAALARPSVSVRDEVLEEAAKVAETLPIGGGTLSSWVNTNESPMGATRRHIAAAIRALKSQPVSQSGDDHGKGERADG